MTFHTHTHTPNTHASSTTLLKLTKHIKRMPVWLAYKLTQLVTPAVWDVRPSVLFIVSACPKSNNCLRLDANSVKIYTKWQKTRNTWNLLRERERETGNYDHIRNVETE